MTEQRPIRVLLVDDHSVVREGLVRILARCPDIEIAAQAQRGEEALALVDELAPDLVLLDLSLPDIHGLEILTRLRRRPHPPRVVVLTVHDDDDIVLRAVRAGAEGYVLKTASREELLTAIRRVAAGGRAFDDVVLEALVHNTQQEGSSGLTGRELEILQLVADGHTNKAIAARLYVSADTVNGHLDNIYRKLGVSDRAHAVAVGLRSGLLQ